LRIPSYICRSICYQLCCVLLTLPLLVLPLAAAEPVVAQILTPLATDLVPLGSSIQSSPATPLQIPQWVAPARHLMGPPPAALFKLKPEAGRRADTESPDLYPADASDSPHGRSPPST
jgi:hypothetical protein